MAMVYSLAWLLLIVLSLIMMVGLYSRVVYTLWFKHDDDNQLTSQQRVSVPYKHDLTCEAFLVTLARFILETDHPSSTSFGKER